MNKVVAIKKDETGSICQYKLDNGQIMNRQEICNAATRGEIEGVAAFTTRDGGESVRSNRGNDDYSLSNLPEF